jgi:hypothetical protein
MNTHSRLEYSQYRPIETPTQSTRLRTRENTLVAVPLIPQGNQESIVGPSPFFDRSVPSSTDETLIVAIGSVPRIGVDAEQVGGLVATEADNDPARGHRPNWPAIAAAVGAGRTVLS